MTDRKPPARPVGRPPAPPARKTALKVSTPAEKQREDALFADAGLDATAAAAGGKDPVAAASILARKHPHAVVRLIGGALHRWDEPAQRAARRVAENLFDKGARLIDVFLRVTPRNDVVLERCARLVGEIGGREGVARLHALLKDPSPAVRVAAFEGLAHGLTPDQLVKLAAEVVVDESEKPEVKRAAIEALGEARAIGGSAVCARVIHDGNAEVRKAAARSLARMGVGALPGIFEDVRKRGQAALGLVVDSIRAVLGGGDLASAPPELLAQTRKLLAATLRDKDSFVRWGAGSALAVVGGKDELPALEDAATFEKYELAKANLECARAELKRRLGV